MRWTVVAFLIACGGNNSTASNDAAAPEDASSSPPDASAEASAEAGPPSRCVVDSSGITCQSQSLTLSDGSSQRTVTYETPLGAPPTAGWPVVVYFQGSFIPGHTAFAAVPSAPYGMYELTLTIQALLDGGWAVISPDAYNDGGAFWETNIPPYATNWPGCPDDVLMQNLFTSLGKGDFGPVDTTHLYAMGISSGGFMTSRMAVSYAGKFRALADCSGSYATCGRTCSVPTPLPSNHPPTIFLHGGEDTIVPMSAVQPYIDALDAEGFVTKLVTDPSAGHQWLAAGPTAIPAWFAAH